MRDDGATAAEYGLMITGVAVVIALAVFFFGSAVLSLFDRSGSCIAAGASSTC